MCQPYNGVKAAEQRSWGQKGGLVQTGRESTQMIEKRCKGGLLPGKAQPEEEGKTGEGEDETKAHTLQQKTLSETLREKNVPDVVPTAGKNGKRRKNTKGCTY